MTNPNAFSWKSCLNVLWAAAFIMSTPAVLRADGIKIQEITLSPSAVALMAKILLLNAKKHTAKVRVLKVYGASREINSLPRSAEEPASLAAGDEVELPLHRPTEPVPHKWVLGERYWDRAARFAEGDTVFLVQAVQGPGYHVVSHSAAKEKKFDLVFDPQNRAAALKAASLDDLRGLLGDRDLETDVTAELTRRGALSPDVLAKIPDETFYHVFKIRYKALSAEEQGPFLRALARELRPQKEDRVRLFLNAVRNLNVTDLPTRMAVLSELNMAQDAVQSDFQLVCYELEKSIGRDGSLASPAAPLYLAAVQHTAPDRFPITPETLFPRLTGAEKTTFETGLAEVLVKKDSDRLRCVFKEVAASGNLEAARLLMKIPLGEYREAEASPAFNHVLGVLFEKENLKDPDRRRAVMDYAEQYVAKTDYPLSLTPENRKRYMELGGYVLNELMTLRVEEAQPAQTELLDRFSTFFSVALVIRVESLSPRVGSHRVARYAVDAVWGGLAPSREAGYEHMLAVSRLAVKGTTVLARVPVDSAALLEDRIGVPVLLVAGPHSSSFLMYKDSLRDKVDAAFQNPKK